MSMMSPFWKRICLVIGILSLSNLPAGATVFLSLEGSGADGNSWATAYHDVAQAVADAAATGEELWVAEGTYQVDAKIVVGSNLTMYGGFPSTGSPALGDRDAKAHETVFTGRRVADILMEFNYVTDTQIDGLTFTGSGHGPAVNFQHSTATVANCVFKRNYSNWSSAGIGMNYSTLTCNDCLFLENSARDGGGVGGYNCTLNCNRCVFERNYASNTGGGIELHEGTGGVIANCLFLNNRANRHGGGVRYDYQHGVTITGCTFVGNDCYWEQGGGLVLLRTTGSVANCIFMDNTARAFASIQGNPRPTVQNCLFHQNPDGHYVTDDVGVVYTIEGPGGLNDLVAQASGNIEADPLFVNIASKNYHLTLQSPCVDTGISTPDASSDFDGENRPVDFPGVGQDGTGVGFDIGYDEYKDSEAQPDGMPDWFETRYGLDLAHDDSAGDPDGDGLSNIEEYMLGTDPHEADTDGDGVPDGTEVEEGTNPLDLWRAAVFVSPLGDNSDGASWGTAFHTIEDGVSVATAEGKDVWVAEGVYGVSSPILLSPDMGLYGGFPDTGDPSFGQRNPHLHPTVVEPDGTPDRAFAGNSIWNSRIEGFTFRGFTSSQQGAAVSYGGACVGIALHDCTFSNNSTTAFGGGVYIADSMGVEITDCEFSGNRAAEGGGINLHRTNTEIRRCRFTNNSAVSLGGGVADYSSTLSVDSCFFSGGTAEKGGAFECHEGGPIVVANCIMQNNESTNHGGALNFEFSGNVTIRSCTFAENSTVTRGGAVFCHETTTSISDSIFFRNGQHAIYENSPSSDVSVRKCLFSENADGVFFDESSVSIMAIEGPTGLNELVAEAEGNLDGQPIFVADASGECHLAYGSAALDAGTTGGVTSVDIDTEDRPFRVPGVGGENQDDAYDIGADEFVDTDGDRLSDFQERLIGTNPYAVDSDHDGLPDGFEVGYDGDYSGLDAYDTTENPAGADLNPFHWDTDGDGVADGSETQFGFDPLDPASIPDLPVSTAALAAIAIAVGVAARRSLSRR